MDGKKVETNSLGNQTLHVIGLSQLVKDYESMFLVDVEDDIEIVDPAKVTLVPVRIATMHRVKGLGSDNRPGRENEMWVNVIVKKTE
ncbi:MAG: hypothetical protein IJ683_01060 [Butyrivibrio sp.]|nr:hypothetical protein [Butyrivibrio sp.]MBR1640909.1 hypothetical protein [Butyrivibrio sp.]